MKIGERLGEAKFGVIVYVQNGGIVIGRTRQIPNREDISTVRHRGNTRKNTSWVSEMMPVGAKGIKTANRQEYGCTLGGTSVKQSPQCCQKRPVVIEVIALNLKKFIGNTPFWFLK